MLSTFAFYQRRLLQTGFTAIELMVVVAILGILAALAAPSFQAMIEKARVRSAAASLQSATQYARNAAINLRRQVFLMPMTNYAGASSEQLNCRTSAPTAKTEWGCGLVVVQDADRSGDYDATKDGAPLRFFDAFNGVDVTQDGADDNRKGLIVYRPLGVLGTGTMGSFLIKPVNAADDNPRIKKMCLSRTATDRVIGKSDSC